MNTLPAASVTVVEEKLGYVVLQVICVYEIPVMGTDVGDCIDNAYALSSEEIKKIGNLENIELDYAEFRHWDEN